MLIRTMNGTLTHNGSRLGEGGLVGCSNLAGYFCPLLRENVKLWVKAHNIQRKFEKGTKLKITTALNREKLAGEIVYITGVKEDEANYLVDKDKNRQGGTVISFERVESNCEYFGEVPVTLEEVPVTLDRSSYLVADLEIQNFK